MPRHGDGVAAVAHQHQGAVGQPAAQLQDHLAGPVSEFFVAASALPAVAFRGRQHGKEWQGPIASRPGDMAQPHQGDPAQAAGLDQVAPAGTHRIAVDAQGFDFRAAAPFQGFVDAEDQRTIALIQVLEQQHEQDASRLAGRPHRPVEHLMVAGVVEVVAAAHDAQRRGHGALAGASIAPASRIWAFSQVGLRNSVAKGWSTGKMASGRVSMAGPSVRSGFRPAYLVFLLSLTFA